MIFHSLDFLVFLVVVFSSHWLLRGARRQNAFLLLASYFFYGYVHAWFLVLIVVSTLVDYCAVLGMVNRPQYRRRFLLLSILTNLGILGSFKYFGFFVENVRLLLEGVGLPSFGFSLDIILPVGISFYTFQSLSYTIDVYKGRTEPARDLLSFALFVGYLPQLVAGPIERASRLLPQLQAERTLSLDAVRSASTLVLWGLFKKLVIADNVAVTANKVFSISSPSFPILWSGVFAFCIQIYADFSAYSDIARGASRMLGIRLMVNFHHPYLSSSLRQFWTRWHISLSEWMRDYVYIPLGGSKGGAARTYLNLVATFLISGLWHGASWNFVIWGVYWECWSVWSAHFRPPIS